ncbi:MAG: Zn-ribbon domain-containing OB-fold protein [Candidatus Binatia bacterium]|nr:Zn-ribbon domain-containing OB-fold protein [Candidatus Binatia bacterium]
MAEATPAAGPLPVVDFLKIPEAGDPYLEGHRCKKCSAMFLGPRATCAKCFARGQVEPVRLSNKGELYSFSIVYRSFPGIDTPYISAIVDLEGGGTVKGNLVDIEPDPKNVEFGMPVEVVYRDALGRKDKDGNSYLSYFFKPRS